MGSRIGRLEIGVRFLNIILIMSLGFTQNITAQVIVKTNSNLQCGDYTYCVDLTLEATSGNVLDIGTSALLLNYNTEALSFKNYTPNNFDSITCSSVWSPQQYDLDQNRGDFSLTMKVLNTASNCNTINQVPKTIGTICFDILQQGGNPMLTFNANQTQFNQATPNNGTSNLTVSLDSITMTGELSCDCQGIGTACDDFNVFTTNDQYDINCNCKGETLDIDTDGIADGVDPCLDIHYEAEDAYIAGTWIQTKTNYPQYFGQGYVDYGTWSGDSVLFTITVADSGSYDLAFRFANGDGSDRQLQFTVDDVMINPALNFPTDTSWAIWNTVLVTQTFLPGTHTILLGTYQGHGPNLDRMTVSFCTGCSLANIPCNDGDTCTVLDRYDVDCNCKGVFLDSDSDGVCDENDICANGDDNIDTDGDNIPDACDPCDDSLVGTTCDDGNPCTINDAYTANCGCVGTTTGSDSDGDGVCDAFDICAGGDDTQDIDNDGTPDFCDTCNDALVGSPCDDGNPCTVLDVIQVDCGCGGIPIYLDIAGIVTDLSCFDSDNGQIDLNISGSVGELNYNWSTGSNETGIDSLAPGLYHVTVSDFRNCTDSDTFTVTEPNILAIGINSLPSNDSSGSIDLTPIGGTAPYSYTWETGDSINIIQNLAPDTYDATVTDANGCIEVLEIDVYPDDMCVDYSIQAEDGIMMNMGTNLWHPAYTLGEGYIYFSNDTLGEVDYNLNIPADGYYTVGFRYSDKHTDRKVKILINNVVEFQEFIFPRTYDWDNYEKIEFVEYFTTGTHTLTLAYAQSWGPRLDFVSVCNQVVVPVTSETTTIDNVCFGASDGSATAQGIGGTRIYNYLWNTGETTATINNLAKGDYYVTVSDDLGQLAYDTIVINEPTEITPVFTLLRKVKCYGETNGRANIDVTGGTSGYSYAWSHGPTWKSTYNVAAGTYILTVTDAAGCTKTFDAIIEQPDSLQLSFATTPSTVTGSNGTIDMSITGGNDFAPYDVFWKDSTLTEDRLGLAVGYYKVTVTDTLGCKVKDGTSVFPDSVCLDIILQAEDGVYNNLSYNIWNPVAATGRGYIHFSDDSLGQADYTINIPGDGYFTVAFRYSSKWNDGQVAVWIDNTIEYQDYNFPRTYDWEVYQMVEFTRYFTAGTHILSLKHRKNWTPRIDFIAICDQRPSVIANATNNICNGDANGTATVSASGGIGGGLTYLWNTGDTTTTITGLTAGMYVVIVTDSIGQMVADTVMVNQPDSIIANFNTTDIDCNGNSTGQAIAIPTGGISPYNYNWSNGVTTSNNVNLTNGNYIVTITDNNGCTALDTAIITTPTALIATGVATNSDGTDGTIDLTATGGITPYTYSWNDGNTSEDRTGLDVGHYTVTITDNNACTTIESYDVYLSTTCIDAVYQAEDATINAATVQANHATGALGSGFVDFTASVAESVTFDVQPGVDTFYEVTIRYTQGSANKTLEISIDGTIEYANLIFPQTADWSTWDYLTFKHYLTAGNHTISIRNVAADGPDLDYLSTCMTTPDSTTATTVVDPNVQVPTLHPYPNPATDMVTVEVQLFKIKTGTLILYDVHGKVLLEKTINNQQALIQEQFDVSNMAAGSYFILLKTDYGTIVKKLVVVR